MFAGRWRRVSTAGKVDLSAVSWLSGSGSRVVSKAKGTVTRWKAEIERSVNSSRVNVVDSAGGDPDAGHRCGVELAGELWPAGLAGVPPRSPSSSFYGLGLGLGSRRGIVSKAAS